MKIAFYFLTFCLLPSTMLFAMQNDTLDEQCHKNPKRARLNEQRVHVKKDDSDDDSQVFLESIKKEYRDDNFETENMTSPPNGHPLPENGSSQEKVRTEQAFITAAERGKLEKFKKILLIPDLNINARRGAASGSTALMLAVKKRHYNIVRLLLESPVLAMNLVNSSGFTALIYAISNEDDEMVELLLTQPSIDINIQGTRKKSALLIACSNGSSKIVQLLLRQESIDVNVRDPYTGITPLIAAVMEQHEEVIELLLKHPKILINTSDVPARNTALHYALKQENEAIIQLFLAMPTTDINIRNDDGETPLIAAVKYAPSGLIHKRIVELLLNKSHIAINVKDKSGWTALMHACIKIPHNPDAVRLLIQQGSDVDYAWHFALTNNNEGILIGLRESGVVIPVDQSQAPTTPPRQELAKEKDQSSVHETAQSDNGAQQELTSQPVPAMPVAAATNAVLIQQSLTTPHQKSSLEKCREFLQIPGIDINLPDARGNTALLSAVHQGNREIVKLLLEQPNINVNIQNQTNWTPLMMAVWLNNTEIVRMFCARSDVDVNKGNLLISAADSGSREIVQLLCNNPTLNVNAYESGRTALICAVRHGFEDIVKILLTKPGIEVDAKDEHGETALTLAAEKGFVTLAQLLMQAGANPLHALNFADKASKKPGLINCLMRGGLVIGAQCQQRTEDISSSHSVTQSHTELLEMLDPNCIMSPLLFAALKGNVPLIQSLLERGAFINIVDHNKNTPLHIAILCGFNDAAYHLIKAGADLNLQNKFGQTPLMLAAQKGPAFQNIYRSIIEKGADQEIKDTAGRTHREYLVSTANRVVIPL